MFGIFSSFFFFACCFLVCFALVCFVLVSFSLALEGKFTCATASPRRPRCKHMNSWVFDAKHENLWAKDKINPYDFFLIKRMEFCHIKISTVKKAVQPLGDTKLCIF